MTNVKRITKGFIRERRRNASKDFPSWRKKEGGRIRPVVKQCIKCKKRKVKFHHVLCVSCWKRKSED